MLINIINYFLIFSISIEVLLVWLLLRQENKNFFSSAFIYVILLFSLDTISSLFIVNSPSADVSLIASKARFIIECFVIAILYNFTRLFTFSETPPKISFRNTSTFIIAFLISFGGLFNFLVRNIEKHNGINLPAFSSYYWIFILFLFGVFYLIFISIISKYRAAKKKSEIGTLKDILLIIFPLAFISISAIYVLPFFQIFSPLFFLGYFILAILLIYSALQFYFLEADEYSLNLIPYIITAGFFLLIFALLFNIETNLFVTVISIPGFVLLVLSGNKLSQTSLKIFRKFQFEQNENLDQKIEDFSTRIVQLIDMKQLWDFTTKFLREIFEFQKIAVVSFQYDVSPYQIDALVDVNHADFRKIISESNSPVMEVLESDRKMVNKFEFTNDSLIYKKMESMNMYLAIPLLRQNEILGFIFLGGEQKFVRIPHRHLQLIKLLCSQIAFAIDNIRTIQKTLQARKMAEIGVLASQLAHDFQSFISIVKMENRDNNLLRQQATYAEKLVQDLLNYARPQDLRFNLVNINDLIDMSLDLIELRPNIVIEKNYAESLPEINLDIDQIRRVFKNLIENSSRALKNINNKRLKITTRQLRPISKIQRNPWIYVEILDEGVGIPEEYLDKIFDPFFTTNKNEGGNGLGLAIVKQIITRHHGFIDVTSRPGKGTIFSIRLPHIII